MADWDTVPFVSLLVIDGGEPCPEEHPEEVIYQDFPGIENRIAPAKLSNIKGRKICGKRGGRNFKDAIRPNLIDG